MLVRPGPEGWFGALLGQLGPALAQREIVAVVVMRNIVMLSESAQEGFPRCRRMFVEPFGDVSRRFWKTGDLPART